MAFYKKAQMKVNGKWYPKSVLVVSPATTEQVAKRIAAESTVSPADVQAVLIALGGVMSQYSRFLKRLRICACSYPLSASRLASKKSSAVNARLSFTDV